MGRMQQPEIQHRHQALPAGDELGILSQLICQSQRRIDGVGGMIVKRWRFHFFVGTTSSTFGVPFSFMLTTAFV